MKNGACRDHSQFSILHSKFEIRNSSFEIHSAHLCSSIPVRECLGDATVDHLPGDVDLARSAEEESLRVVDAQLACGREALGALHTLEDHFASELVGERHDVL